jgi:predicted DNA-binding WGR domain protein
MRELLRPSNVRPQRTVMPTATTTGPGRATVGSERETIHGWELHVTSRQRDAYYAVLVIRASVIVAYGRRRARCQATVHRRGTLEAALRKAQVMTDDKVSEGYQVTRDTGQVALLRGSGRPR